MKQFEQEYQKLILACPKVNLFNVKAEDSYSNYVQYGKNNQFCSLVLEGSNRKYCTTGGLNGEAAMFDGYATTNCAYTLETIGLTGTNSSFILTGENTIDNCFYCQHVNACKDCFGCEGLKQKQFCILNKQYTKEEYDRLVPRIIEQMKADGEWGEFFPIVDSTFGYNETLAQRFYPITKEEADAKGYKRCDIDYQINIPEGLEQIQ